MTGMTPEEAERFYEDDEDPQEIFAAFAAARKGFTSPLFLLEVSGPYLQPALTTRQGREGIGVKLRAVLASPIVASTVKA